MASAQNQIANMYQSQLEASRQFADVMFSGTEKIDHVVIEATHRAFTDQLELVEEFAATRDLNEVVNLQSQFFSQTPKNAVICQKEIMRIFAEVQNEMSQSLRDYMGQLGTSSAASDQGSIKDIRRSTSESGFVNPITGMFSVWESAFKEVASLADKNLHMARSSVEQIGKLATDTLSKSTEEAKSALERSAGSLVKVEEDIEDVTDKVSPSSEERPNINIPLSASSGQSATYSNLEGGEIADDKKSPLGGGKRK
jgi:hypothetical protein